MHLDLGSMSIHRNKRLHVYASLVALVVVAAYSLMDFNSADERGDATVAKTQNERLAPPVINRKTPSSQRRKMLQAPTLARHVASQIESEEKMSLRVSAVEIGSGTSMAELASEKNQIMDKLLIQLAHIMIILIPLRIIFAYHQMGQSRQSYEARCLASAILQNRHQKVVGMLK